MSDIKTGYLIARNGDPKDGNTLFRVYYAGENRAEDTSGYMLVSLISSNCVALKNAGLTRDNNGKAVLTGTNGSLNRLPNLSAGERGLTVLQEYTDGTKTVGYLVCSEAGAIKKFKQSSLITLAMQYANNWRFANKDYAPITNGKIVTKDGVQIVSSIKGEYDKSVVKPKKDTAEKQSQLESDKQNRVEKQNLVDLKKIVQGISKAGKKQIKNYQSSMDLALIYLASEREVLDKIQTVLSVDASDIRTEDDIAERVLRKKGRLAFRTKAGSTLDLSNEYALWRTKRVSVG